MKSLLQAIAAAATAIVGLAKVSDLVAGTNIITSWVDAVYLFLGIFVCLVNSAVVYGMWFGALADPQPSRRAKWARAGATLVAVGMAVATIITVAYALSKTDDVDFDRETAVAFLGLLVSGSLIILYNVSHWLRTRARVRCPLCKEKIHREAVRCKHCHASLLVPEPPPAPLPQPRLLMQVRLPRGLVIRVQRGESDD